MEVFLRTLGKFWRKTVLKTEFRSYKHNINSVLWEAIVPALGGLPVS